MAIWKFHQWHVGNCIGISIDKTSTFSLRILFEKIEYLCSLLGLVIWYQYNLPHLLTYLWFPAHSSRSNHWCSRRKAVWILRRTCSFVFGKINCSKNSRKLCKKTIPAGERFKYTSKSSWGFSREQFRVSMLLTTF